MAAKPVGRRTHRLGILRFSAGGHAAGAATGYDAESQPSLAAPISAACQERPVPADVQPLFVALAGNDELVNVQGSVVLHSAWRAVDRRAALHVHAHGGHGFAPIRPGLSSDCSLDRCWEWLRAAGFVPDAAPGGGGR